jgi:hypothetical protein
MVRRSVSDISEINWKCLSYVIRADRRVKTKGFIQTKSLKGGRRNEWLGGFKVKPKVL